MSRVELHTHLDGAIKPTTLWELAKKRGLKVPGNNLEEFTDYVTINEPRSLEKMLNAFQKVIIPTINGNREAIIRIAYELCEIQANNGTAYFEVRYSPHYLANCDVDLDVEHEPGDLTAREVVKCVNEGLRKGSNDFGVKAKSLLCCIRHKPEWSAEVLSLCREFHNDTVVGIDIAFQEIVPSDPLHIQTFQEAYRCGIHRTAHAGETTSSLSVKEAIDEMKAERIGHGYYVLEDEELYKKSRDMDIHFEVCPTSSYLLGNCKYETHPVKRFAADKANFSINTDDPGIFKTDLTTEFNVAQKKIELTEHELIRATKNAARSCFLPEDEKKDLIAEINKSLSSYIITMPTQ